MNTPAVATHLLTNPDQYLTPIGKFLRKSSLDELPQLFSILKGDMSFVCPGQRCSIRMILLNSGHKKEFMFFPRPDRLGSDKRQG
ncbi:MAG: sugar transferase [Planctomycetia bacterium]|nr:sugar transferase [Planctomycetia bacterium]